MSMFRGLGRCAGYAVLIAALGCRSTARSSLGSSALPPEKPPLLGRNVDNDAGNDTRSAGITLISDEKEVVASDGIDAAKSLASSDPFDESSELSLPTLIAAVIERNPTMHAAHAAWSAAAERYPQVVALDDPTLQTMLAPATLASNSSTQASYILGVAQRVPWRGKLSLRGQMAQWDAQAASWDAEEVKLRLTAASRLAFLDFYLVRRELESNRQNVELMQDFRATARSKYEANQVSAQDVSAADLELAKLQQQHLELVQNERIAVARINTLLHQRPDHPLPSAPARLDPVSELPTAETLREMAIEHRPELASLASKIQSEQNAVALACKDYYPDFELMGRYDSFWTDRVQRGQIGMYMNMPLNRDRRAAAVREAQFRLRKLIAEHAQQEDAVSEEVQIALSRVLATQASIQLFEEQILPAAQTNLDAARAAYIAGSIDFLRLMEARKQFTDQQIAYQRALADYHRNRSELQRSVGTEL